MGEIAKPTIKKYWVAKSPSVVHTGFTTPEQVTTTGQPTFEYFDDEQGQLKAMADSATLLPILPTVGTLLLVGETYKVGVDLYRIRQTHARTADIPSTVPALFTWVRPIGESIDWIAQEAVGKGDRRKYADVLYECIQSHQTQADWTPPVVPALWQVVPTATPGAWIPREEVTVGVERTYKGSTWVCAKSHTTQVGWEPDLIVGVLWTLKPSVLAWADGQVVKRNDLRTHDGFTYTCLQAHTTQIGWEPPNVPALWKKK